MFFVLKDIMLRLFQLASKEDRRYTKMNKLKTFIAVAALSVTVGANALAKEIVVQEGDSITKETKVQRAAVEEKIDSSPEIIQNQNIKSEITEENYIVKPNDTLSDIAVNHEVSVEEIKVWNDLTTDTIHPGLEIVINDGETGIEEVKPTTNNTVEPNEPAAPVEQPAPVETNPESDSTVTNETPQEAENAQTEKEITVTATAYTASCEGCSGITATGVNIKDNPEEKVIAVDPSVIPLGSKVYVEGYGYATAADTGGAIKGNRIDVFIPEQQDAVNWGKKQVEVTILN